MKILHGVFLIVLMVMAAIFISLTLPETTDVVVVGAGAAGISAALEADGRGAEVVLLEKMPYIGGNSTRATAGINAALGADDVAPFIAETLTAGQGVGNENLVTTLIKESGKALSWLRSLGADLSDRGRLAGHSTNRTHRPTGGAPVGVEIVGVLGRVVGGSTVDLRLENRALTIEPHRRGFSIVVENATGREYRLNTKAVIITTGGYGGNPVLFTQYNPRLKGFNTTNTPGATGDFITLTEELGVRLIGLGDIQTHPTVQPDFGILITEALRGNGSILVNTQGRRFTDEMAFRDGLSRNILEQPEQVCWLIFDEGIRGSLASANYYIRKDLVLSGSSLEELSLELHLDPGIFKDTMVDWNRAINDGFDSEFGRQDLGISLESAPFYAIKVAPGVHYCMGGLAIDVDARVLDEEGFPISGLYAAGEATGGIHGKDRLGGNSLMDAVVFGRIAGSEVGEFLAK